jgi:hypothetical protein
MASYRQRVSIQKKQKQVRNKKETSAERKERYARLKTYLIHGISMCREVSATFDPLSEEDRICTDMITQLSYELEIVTGGTDAEREEVYEKYGECIR